MAATIAHIVTILSLALMLIIAYWALRDDDEEVPFSASFPAPPEPKRPPLTLDQLNMMQAMQQSQQQMLANQYPLRHAALQQSALQGYGAMLGQSVGSLYGYGGRY